MEGVGFVERGAESRKRLLVEAFVRKGEDW